jgi:ABC-2 type transport system ATP-binding protein
MNAIEIKDLSRAYGKVRALDGLNLSVEAGSVFGFLGPNGAGKTTTLRILTGLAKAGGGQAWLNGKPLSERKAAVRAIGYLPEEPGFYRWMTPYELLDHVGRTFGLPARVRRERCLELLEQVGLQEVMQRRIAGFSRGMRQRLGLAQALVNSPSILLLDEPVSALDPLGRKEVLEMIAALKGRATVFMSTHILADVERICDRVGIIDHGRLITEGQRAELLERYPVDAFEVEVEAGQEKALADWLKGLKAGWLRNRVQEGARVRIRVGDIDQARQDLLASLSRSGLKVQRFELATPTLEDVFLQLVTENGGAR